MIKEEVYLLLGSNLGDSKKYISDAVELIGKYIGKLSKSSSLYQTASWGKTDQPDFINQVVCVFSELPPAEVLSKAIEIEKALGRERDVKWGSRTIDIDILFYGNRLINDPDLVIPHPLLHQRRFTLLPLAELAPRLVHPKLNQTITDLLDNLNDELAVQKLA